jgi:hypothetical protein
MVDQYPLFSQSDEALWMLADSYYHMGDRFEDKQADAYTRIVKDYPLSPNMRKPPKTSWQVYEEAGSAARSGGLCAHEVRTGEPHQNQLREPQPGHVPAAPGYARGRQVRHAHHDGHASGYPGQRAADPRRGGFRRAEPWGRPLPAM